MTITTLQKNHPARSPAGVRHPSPSADEVLTGLEIRFAVPADRGALSELAAHSGRTLPRGTFMVGALGERIVAAMPVADGQLIAESTPAGAAAGAVLRFAVKSRRPAHHRSLSHGSPS